MQKSGKRNWSWCVIFIITLLAGLVSVGCYEPCLYTDENGVTHVCGDLEVHGDSNTNGNSHVGGDSTVDGNINLGGGLVTQGPLIKITRSNLSIDGEDWGGEDLEVIVGVPIIFNATGMVEGGEPPVTIYWIINDSVLGNGLIFTHIFREEDIGFNLLTIKVVDSSHPIPQEVFVDIGIEVFEEDEDDPDPPPPPPVLTPRIDLVGPNAANAPFTLSWSGDHLASCEKNGAWSGNTSVVGQETIPLPSVGGTYVFGLKCRGTNGFEVNDAVSVLVTVPHLAPTVTISSLPSISQGTSLSVSHNSMNASSCRGISGPAEWLGPLPLFGSRVFSGLLPGTYRYEVECTGLDGVTKVTAATTTVVTPIVTTQFSAVVTGVTPTGPFVRGTTISPVATVTVTNGDGMQHKLHVAYYDTTVVDVAFTSPVGAGTVTVPLPGKTLTAVTDVNETLFNSMQVWSLANNPEGLVSSFPIVVTLN